MREVGIARYVGSEYDSFFEYMKDYPFIREGADYQGDLSLDPYIQYAVTNKDDEVTKILPNRFLSNFDIMVINRDGKYDLSNLGSEELK